MLGIDTKMDRYASQYLSSGHDSWIWAFFVCIIHERIALKLICKMEYHITHHTCMYPSIELTCATFTTASTGVSCDGKKGRMHTTGGNTLNSSLSMWLKRFSFSHFLSIFVNSVAALQEHHAYLEHMAFNSSECAGHHMGKCSPATGHLGTLCYAAPDDQLLTLPLQSLRSMTGRHLRDQQVQQHQLLYYCCTFALQLHLYLL